MREKKYLCSVDGCGRRYDRPTKLMAHIRSAHTGERPFACDEPSCTSKFARQKELTVHKLKHVPADQKPFQCPTCGKGFNSRQHLALHKGTHEAQAMTCELCGRTYTRPANYKRHIEAHVTCSHCSKVFLNEAQLKTHITKYHDQNYHCGECQGIAFDTYAELQSHTKEQHPRPVQRRVIAAPSIARMTGLEYHERWLDCSHAGCDHRFTRYYDLERHNESVHGIHSSSGTDSAIQPTAAAATTQLTS